LKEGLLWYDSSKSLEKKVGEAAARYKCKHGCVPNLCLVHPSQMNGEKKTAIGTVEVKPCRSVLRHHFWIGQETDENKQLQGEHK
jgi:hypothetical protein